MVSVYCRIFDAGCFKHVSQNKRCAQESARRSNFLLPHRRIIMGHYIAHSFAAHVFHSAQHSKAFNVRMIALKPNFDCVTVIVKHLCATYLGRCIFAAEVKDNGNLRDTHKSVTFARQSN